MTTNEKIAIYAYIKQCQQEAGHDGAHGDLIEVIVKSLMQGRIRGVAHKTTTRLSYDIRRGGLKFEVKCGRGNLSGHAGHTVADILPKADAVIYGLDTRRIRKALEDGDIPAFFEYCLRDMRVLTHDDFIDLLSAIADGDPMKALGTSTHGLQLKAGVLPSWQEPRTTPKTGKVKEGYWREPKSFHRGMDFLENFPTLGEFLGC